MMTRITAAAALALLAACGSASVAEQDSVAQTEAGDRQSTINGWHSSSTYVQITCFLIVDQTVLAAFRRGI